MKIDILAVAYSGRWLYKDCARGVLLLRKRIMEKTASKPKDQFKERLGIVAGHLMFSMFFVLAIHPFIIIGALIQ